jgi:uncharacterized protein YceH (UPF0502 family)
MAETLNEVERRVLGVLLEKALAQPQYYPMTLNAITAGCNQKSNRDPLMGLSEDAVWNTLEVLRAGGLVSRLLPGGAARVERFKHEAKESLGWEKPQRAVMAELLLRGPQTASELRSHCARMYSFDNPEAVTSVLQSLRQAAPPRVAALPRAAGQAAVRYAHCLYPPQEWTQLSQTPAGTTPPAAPATARPVASDEWDDWRTAVRELRSEVAELRAAVVELQQCVRGETCETPRNGR